MYYVICFDILLFEKHHLPWMQKISEEKITDSMNDDIKNSVHAGISAQNYEVDILPRYKEALSLGLSSYKHPLQKTKITASTDQYVDIFTKASSSHHFKHIIGKPGIYDIHASA
ncbi:uncharacterized protein LOC131240050 [Magnolia sinica]|uniref:uncharacterized protein LOC131240050 n=1 Tax=Magnolia sinica TaxID=86752 RepID=UPI002658CF7F|nr:uncharacterized protein LOC131240050 [Magnolia sinica]